MQDIYNRIEELERQNQKQSEALVAILTHLATCDGDLAYTKYNIVQCNKCGLLLKDTDL